MKNLILTYVFSILCIQVYSQQLILSVNTADTIYNFSVVNSSYGPTFTSNISALINAELVFATDDVAPIEDGCDTITNDADGKVAMLYRGQCPFSQKTLNVQEAGGIAMILCNTNPGDNPFVMDGDSTGVSIPSVMARLEDCQLIESVNGEITGVTLSDGVVASTDNQTYPAINYSVYPNPAQSEITVLLKDVESHDALEIQLLNITGSEVLSQSFVGSAKQGNTISVKHLPAGAYLLQGSIGQKQFTEKVIIE